MIYASLLGLCRAESAGFENVVKPFLAKHCHSCHDARKAKAGFRVDQLGLDFLKGNAADEWKEVMDHINLGEMPPKDEPRPDTKESFTVVKWIAAELRKAERAARLMGGRTPMRRLNRDEYANTVRDLLQLDAKVVAPLVEDLPGDGKAEGFDRLGVALFVDATQIDRTLRAAELIAAKAIVDVGEGKRPEVPVTRWEAENPRHLGIRPWDKFTRNRFADKKKVLSGYQKYEVTTDGVMMRQGGPTYQKGNPWGRLCRVKCDELIPEDGYYRIRFRAGADLGFPNQPIKVLIKYAPKMPIETETELTLTHSAAEPGVYEVRLFLRRGADDMRRNLEFFWTDVRDLTRSSDEFKWFFQTLNGSAGKIQKGKAAGTLTEQEEKELLAAIADAREKAAVWKGPSTILNPKYEGKEPPRFFLDWVSLEGPLQDDWPPASHRLVMFDGDERTDAKYLDEIFARFLPRAYRRPVSSAEVQEVVSLAKQRLSESGSFTDAVRAGLERVLVSPGFMFVQEPAAKPRRLNDHELATRLSYFLWSTMPDDRLFQLAQEKRLSRPGVLKAEIQRMLADPKSREFIENFAGQWLSVREFGSVMPAREYSDYDQELEEASIEEAYAFFSEILSKNLPITRFLDSDFVMINERLARHYEIGGVQGEHFRRVALAPQNHRGGIFGMAGLMTLLADGTRTLPVRRAAWIRENIFNDPPPPPPPNAGEVQPNTAGEKLTVRERLERHRNEPTCASCHAPLDPYGLALENYDAIGKWRTQQNGENFRGKRRPELDVSGQLPSGRKFTTLEEFKAALLAEKDAFAHAFSERLLTYALTRPVGYIDHQTVDGLTTALKLNDYRIQPLIEAVVLSEAFQTK